MSERDIFIEAVQIEDLEDRRDFLDRACGNDVSLRERVETLLRAHELGNSYLENPPVTVTDATTDRPVTEQPGTRIGPYKLVQQIGEGGMGVVYMAAQTEPVQRTIALKIIKPGMDTRQVIARFAAERQALALMDHPNIAKVLDAGTTDSGRPFFVMELVHGITITDYCDEQHLTPRERLELFIPICQAVQHAHQKGIIHRDLKPSNVLVAEYDHKAVPKIIDFGVAKATGQQLTERTLYTQLGQIVGTLEYMSPEQAKHNQLDVDTRSDIYSLGVLLYELLTGATPFDQARLRSAAFDEMLRIIREEQPPKPSTRLSSSDALPSVAANRRIQPAKLSALVRGDLDWIVMKSLEKDRSRRYETASAFAADIQHYLHDEPVLAGPPSTIYRFRRFARRHRTALATLAVIFLAILAGLLGTSLQAIRATKAERVARENSAKAERSEQLALNSRRKAIAERDAKEQARLEALANEAKAKVEREKAYLITDFMLSVFRSPDPARAGREITVAEVLQGAVKVLQQRTDLAPQARADLLDAVGDAYEGLGLYQEALDVFQECLRIRRTHLGDYHRETLDAMNLVALAHHNVGNLDEALHGYETTLQLRREHLGPDDLDTIQSINNLASIYRKLDRTDEALPLAKEAFALRRAMLGEKHVDTLLAASNLALALQQAGELPDAIDLFEKTLNILRENESFGSPFDLLVMNNLGSAYLAQGQFDKALPLLKNTLAMRSEKLGSDHPHTLNSMNNLAVLYGKMGREDDALELLEQELELRGSKYGDAHPSLIRPLTNLGRLNEKQRRFETAIEWYERALKLSRSHFDAGHLNTLEIMDHLASAYSSSGQSARAVEILEEVVAQRCAQQGEDHADTLRSMNNLGTAYWRLKQLDRSVATFEKLHRLSSARAGRNSPTTLSYLTNLGVNYRDAGRPEEAVECLEEALRLARELPAAQREWFAWVGPKLMEIYDEEGLFDKQQALLEERIAKLSNAQDVPPSVIYAFQSRLGLCLVRQEEFADAEPILRESLKGRDKEEPDAWSTFNARSLLGQSLLGQERYAEAEGLLVAGYQGLKQRADKINAEVRQQRLVEAAERLVRLYEAMGNEQEATRWRNELATIQASIQ